MTAHQKYIEEANLAGYLVENDNTALVVDRGDFFHIVAQDNIDGDWVVGKFFKSTISKTGDYSGCPDFEGSLEDCVKFVSNWEENS